MCMVKPLQRGAGDKEAYQGCSHGGVLECESQYDQTQGGKDEPTPHRFTRCGQDGILVNDLLWVDLALIARRDKKVKPLSV